MKCKQMMRDEQNQIIAYDNILPVWSLCTGFANVARSGFITYTINVKVFQGQESFFNGKNY